MRVTSCLKLLATAFIGLSFFEHTPAVELLPTFVDITAQAGITFRHTFGDRHMSNIVEATGSGVALLDYNNDGFLDIYFVNGCYLPGVSEECSGNCPEKSARNALYRNNGDGAFTDVTEEAGVADTGGYGMAALAADFDNDGWTDLYITNYGRNTLYRNNRDGTFRDVTTAAGVGDTLWSVGATALDFDNDGFLDIYVGNYLDFDPAYRLYYAADEFPGPLSYPGLPDRLYRNRGDGTFVDVTSRVGVKNNGRAMGVLAADYDDDGWPDIYVANDAGANFLYRNDRGLRFLDRALQAGVAFSESGSETSSMGAIFGDYDNDGDFDILVPDMRYKSLYSNLGNGRFRDVTFSSKIAVISGQYVTWGGTFFDYDHDGWLDVYFANGDAHTLGYSQEDCLLRNVPGRNGERVFEDMWKGSGAFFRTKANSRGMAVGDIDNDGDLDIVVVNIDRASTLLRNDQPAGTPNHWLMITLKGTRSNRDGIGAKVTVRTGSFVQVRQRMAGDNYLSTNDPRLHFGLGRNDRIDEITVRWPGGVTQRVVPTGVDRVITITEPTGVPRSGRGR